MDLSGEPFYSDEQMNTNKSKFEFKSDLNRIYLLIRAAHQFKFNRILNRTILQILNYKMGKDFKLS